MIRPKELLTIEIGMRYAVCGMRYAVSNHPTKQRAEPKNWAPE